MEDEVKMKENKKVGGSKMNAIRRERREREE
jgi:hypothetical protein